MAKYVPMETPGGLIWIEFGDDELRGVMVAAGAGDRAQQAFQDAVRSLTGNAKLILDKLQPYSPTEVEVSFGIKAGAEGGSTFFGLAKATAEAHYTVTVKWTAKDMEIHEQITQSAGAGEQVK